MDIRMELNDFVVKTNGECVIRKPANLEEGDVFRKLYTNEFAITADAANFSISLIDETNQVLGIIFPNDEQIFINADEHPIIENILGQREVLYEQTTIEKWNPKLEAGHFYLTFDDEQIRGVVFLRRLEDTFLEWEEFSRVKNYDSYHTQSRIVQLSVDLLANCKFIPLYGFGVHVDEGDSNGHD